jgi:hypothetical protein
MPPEGENRFSAPPEYPKEASQEKQPKKKVDDPSAQGPGGARFGAGSSGR